MELIRIENLSFTYPNSDNKILNNISLDINEGEFVLLIGESGCGKSTLLKQLKNELAPFGENTGTIFYDGENLRDLDQRKSASEIGFVMQNPDYQIVTDKVWHELAFGLESLGLYSQTIRRRVAEMASFFGIQTWFRKDVSELSGGQKQLLNLAAIMAMQPKVIILDEPTAQLDPIAATEFLETIYKINRELGITIIITEHRLEEVFSVADKVVLMDKGKISAVRSPREIGKIICNKENKHAMYYSMPTTVRIFEECEGRGEAPITIKEGRTWIRNHFGKEESILREIGIDNNKKIEDEKVNREAIIELNNVWFKYERESDDILRGVDIKVYEKEFLCILGGNGTGKSTTLGVITGNNKPYRGEVYIKNKKISRYKLSDLFNNNLGVLPQDPQSLFVKSSVISDLEEVFTGSKISKEEINNKINDICITMGITDLLKSHPYDLSGGEQQKVALAKILLLDPKILVLDEPTKGLDGSFKREMSEILKKLKNNGVTIIMVTHDIEFAAKNADRCALFFDGGIASEGTPEEFFCGNSFYTTSANKMTRGILKDILKDEEVVKIWERVR